MKSGRFINKSELRRSFNIAKWIASFNLYGGLVFLSVVVNFLALEVKADSNTDSHVDHQAISSSAQTVAQYAIANFEQPMLQELKQFVRYKTVAEAGMTPLTNPEFIRFKLALKALSEELGLNYQDQGYVVRITLGEQIKKLTIVTHGDVQPANADLWHQDPFVLDTTSEPGKLIGRGTEDDKGAIITAMYAMKAIKDKKVILERGIELMVYMAEESDWDPMREYLKHYQTGDYTITIDAEYPVVSAEKGWSKISVNLPDFAVPRAGETQPQIVEFNGGYFSSQVPQLANAKLADVSKDTIEQLRVEASKQQGMTYRFEQNETQWLIYAEGKAAHSSTPEDGINAVTHLAALLGTHSWAKTSASMTVRFIDELVGLGIYAEQFGDIAYKDDFMGAMTLAPTVIKKLDSSTMINLNLRRPRGKTPELLTKQALIALTLWQQKHGVNLTDIETYWGKPLVIDSAPHLATLLNVFAHYTGIENPKPVAIGGSTNAKLFPNALSFGPAMPGVEYTGHTEHEFITKQQLLLNLQMYTAAFVELVTQTMD